MRFGIECRNTNTEVITVTNHGRPNRAMNQSKFEPNTCDSAKRGKMRVFKLRLVFGFASHWLRKWREFC